MLLLCTLSFGQMPVSKAQRQDCSNAKEAVKKNGSDPDLTPKDLKLLLANLQQACGTPDNSQPAPDIRKVVADCSVALTAFDKKITAPNLPMDEFNALLAAVQRDCRTRPGAHDNQTTAKDSQPTPEAQDSQPAPEIHKLVAQSSTQSFGQTKPAGPFGFQRGMTREQIINLVGRDAVDTKHSHDEFLRVTTAPKPNRAFDSYLLVVSPTEGLVKMVASGVTVQTGDSGAELREAFDAVVAGVSQKYGEPKSTFDTCTGSDVECSNVQFWMMSLKEKNRSVTAFWLLTQQPINSVTTIEVEVNPLNMNQGWITVAYEFEGFSRYSAAKQAKQNDSY